MQAHINPADISAILITHEHGDHIRGAVRMARKYSIPIVANPATLAMIDEASSIPHVPLELDEEMSVGDMLVRPFPTSHDAVRPVGYSIHTASGTVCLATDTGIITPRIRDELLRADLAILESNHDLEMLLTGPYPAYLKRRIEGEKGHISNDTAAGLVLDIADQNPNSTVWLAHLSEINNTPAIALSTTQYLLWTCLGIKIEVDVVLRDRPSLWWKSSEK